MMNMNGGGYYGDYFSQPHADALNRIKDSNDELRRSQERGIDDLKRYINPELYEKEEAKKGKAAAFGIGTFLVIGAFLINPIVGCVALGCIGGGAVLASRKKEEMANSQESDLPQYEEKNKHDRYCEKCGQYVLKPEYEYVPTNKRELNAAGLERTPLGEKLRRQARYLNNRNNISKTTDISKLLQKSRNNTFTLDK